MGSEQGRAGSGLGSSSLSPPSKHRGHSTSRLSAQGVSPPDSIYANEASSVGSLRPEDWEIPKGNSLQKHSASFHVYDSLKIITHF